MRASEITDTLRQNRSFEDKILLVLATSYPDIDGLFFSGAFIKNQVDVLKGYFKKIIVISPVFSSFGLLEKDRTCHNYTYDNVEIYYPRCFYIPIFWFSRLLIDNRLSTVERLIKKLNLEFDLIHAHFTWPSGYNSIRLKEKYHVPVVTTIHEDGGWFKKEMEMEHPLLLRAWEEADALIRVNRKDISQLQQYNPNVHAIPNGFSPAFHPIDTHVARERLNLARDAKIIFTLGNLIERKGFNYLIDAMKRVCSQRENVICFIGGAGPERKRLKRQIDRLHLCEEVRLLGSVSGDQLTLWMNACDLFVLPSLNEGNPTVMFETLGCGKPFVGTRVGGVPEVIVSDEYGLLVKPADPEDLAEKILAALDRKWDQTAILRHAEWFTWENIAKEIIDVYTEVLE